MDAPRIEVRSANVSSARTESAAAIVGIARAIWAEVRASGVAADDDAGNARLLAELRKKHRDFATTFPIPLRWMVQARDFAAKPFERYLAKHVKAHYRDRRAFMLAQAEYLVLLYRHRHPRAPGGEVTRYREAITKSLEEDDRVFMEAQDEVAEELKRLDAAVDADRRRRLYEFLLRRKTPP